MHISLATHICGGEIAAMKLSFSGEKASCGMLQDKTDCGVNGNVKSNCCHDKIAFYAVDNNYNPSNFQCNNVTNSISQLFYVTLFASIPSNNLIVSTNSIINKPDNLNALANAVSLADICVFRI